jgi:hypothetical protein
MIVKYLTIFIIFLTVLLFYLINKFQRNKVLKFLPIFYDGKIKSHFLFYPKISGYHNSIFTEAIFYPKSKNSPAKLKILMNYRQNERWKIKRKIPYDIDLSFMEKIEVDDEFFKDYFVIRAKGEEFIRPILQDPKKKELIKKLFEKKEAQILEAKNGKIIFLLSNITPDNIQIEEFEEILRNLISLTL